VCAKALDRGEAESSAVFSACLSGNVGDDSAIAFMAIRKIRHQLPSIPEIRQDPLTAKLPHDINSAISVLGVLAQVAAIDAPAANIYADRLQNEARVAATNMLGRFGLKKFEGAPNYQDGIRARNRLLATIGKIIPKL
jgi:hypothetical protein